MTANFLLSIEAQVRASDPDHMGSTPAISISDLDSEARRAFDTISRDLAAPSAEDLDRKLQEPHPSWMPALEKAWIQRYSTR